MSLTLGQDVETGASVSIGDVERFSGLYILGQAGTGKSELLVSLALKDIEQGENGLLFIDPHGDAIEKILARMPDERKKRVILIDPTDKDYTFSINPLRCDKPEDIAERVQVFEQTRDVFVKLETLFGDEKLGVLLNKYLQYILYPLLYNPGSTLYDINLMLDNKEFRERLLGNMGEDLNAYAARRFWHDEFDLLIKHDQHEELKSTRNRVSLFDNEFVRAIIAQKESTINFADIMDSPYAQTPI